MAEIGRGGASSVEIQVTGGGWVGDTSERGPAVRSDLQGSSGDSAGCPAEGFCPPCASVRTKGSSVLVQRTFVTQQVFSSYVAWEEWEKDQSAKGHLYLSFCPSMHPSSQFKEVDGKFLVN